MKNKLEDLNDHLFAQLERLGEEDLTSDKEKLRNEVERSKALTDVSTQIVNNTKMALEVTKFMTGGDRLPVGHKAPAMLQVTKDE